MNTVSLGPVWDEAQSMWENFYPAELPKEWRLNFVVHHWPNVLLTPNSWSRWLATTRDWSESPEAMRLFFHVHSGVNITTDEWTSLHSILDERLGGILCSEVSLTGFPDCLSPILFLRRSAGLQCCGPSDACLDFEVYENATDRVVVCRDAKDLSLRQWRLVLESLCSSSREVSTLRLFFQIPPGQMGQLNELAWLLGLGR